MKVDLGPWMSVEAMAADGFRPCNCGSAFCPGWHPIEAPATQRLSFTVPLPPRDLSPNARRGSSRLAKSGTVREYRECIAQWAVAARSDAGWEAPQQASVTLVFCLKDRPAPLGEIDRAMFYHPKDQDNALSSWKAGLDGLRDAHIVRGDEWDAVALTVRRDTTRGPYVEVKVEVLA